MKKVKVFAYKSSRLGKCGIRSTGEWQAEYATSKAEVIRRHHRNWDGNRLIVITQEELDELMRNDPSISVVIDTGKFNFMKYTPDGIKPLH